MSALPLAKKKASQIGKKLMCDVQSKPGIEAVNLIKMDTLIYEVSYERLQAPVSWCLNTTLEWAFLNRWLHQACRPYECENPLECSL